MLEHDPLKAAAQFEKALVLGLPPSLRSRAHCELGMAYCELEEFSKALDELKAGAASADKEYLKSGSIWKWLALCSAKLGHQSDAEMYARMLRPM
jgi:Tfp pilus assembly protein PilF